MSELIEGVTKVTDVTGPAGQAGTDTRSGPGACVALRRSSRPSGRIAEVTLREPALRGETNVTFEPRPAVRG